ncbi:hypothetical protein Aperf_G00000014165 [Anoplocephala perfoliata]
MALDEFQVLRFMGKGKDSIIYEVFHKQGNDKGTLYALKRFFLLKSSSVYNARHERLVLKRLAREKKQSPFMTQLFYATGGIWTPALVMTKGSGFNLEDLRISKGALSETDAKFYVSEIICGLEYLHTRRIVHLDIKLQNVLLSETGHILIADFDLAYDLSGRIKHLDSKGFAGTYEYMAPEIANHIVVTTKADVWSLGALTVRLLCHEFRPIHQSLSARRKAARAGEFEIAEWNRFSEPLQGFLSACLTYDYKHRLRITELKGLAFFSDTDWHEVETCELDPPFEVTDLSYRGTNCYYAVNPEDPSILRAAFEIDMPLIESNRNKTISEKKRSERRVLKPDRADFEKAGLTNRHIRGYFVKYAFTNPLIQEEEEDDKEEEEAMRQENLRGNG